MIKEKSVSERRTGVQPGKTDDGLGTNTDIGRRLKALYGSVQEESVPDHLLDLLEKLDSVEQAHPKSSNSKAAE
jgi:hypothetical protein